MSFSSMALGQYIPTGSLVHRLDPRGKLFALLLLVSAVFTADTVPSLACCVVVLLGLVALARLPWGAVLRSARPIFFLAAFTLLFNVLPFLWKGEGVIRSVWAGGFVALRLLVLMLFSVLLPLTTAPLELADGVEELLRPLARFGFPAHECAIMIGMTLRFIPLLMTETDRIMKAQLSRGARLDQGGLFRRILAFFPVLIPLFIIIFRRADEMALAMEARGYQGGMRRTRLRPLQWKKSDTASALLCSALVALLFLMRRIG